MTSNIMNLDEVLVGRVMTPRTRMIAVSVGATLEQAQALMLETGHLRLPVYEGIWTTCGGSSWHATSGGRR